MDVSPPHHPASRTADINLREIIREKFHTSTYFVNGNRCWTTQKRKIEALRTQSHSHSLRTLNTNPTYAIESKALPFFRRGNARGKVHEDEANKKKSILIAFARLVLPHLALILTRLHRVNKNKNCRYILKRFSPNIMNVNERLSEK